MKVITKNSIYIVDVKARTVTGGALADEKLHYEYIGSVNKGESLLFYDGSGNIILRTSPVCDITASLFDDA